MRRRRRPRTWSTSTSSASCGGWACAGVDPGAAPLRRAASGRASTTSAIAYALCADLASPRRHRARFGPYKLSLHSGSGQVQHLPAGRGSHQRRRCISRLAGTSMLTALRRPSPRLTSALPASSARGTSRRFAIDQCLLPHLRRPGARPGNRRTGRCQPARRRPDQFGARHDATRHLRLGDHAIRPGHAGCPAPTRKRTTPRWNGTLIATWRPCPALIVW